MGKFDLTSDEEFTSFVDNVKKDLEEREARKANGGNGFTPEDIKWAGLPEKKMEIVRLLGKPPRATTAAGPYDMHEIYTTEIKDDDGKVMKLNLPVREETTEKDHVLWRAIDQVTKVAWLPDPTSKEKKNKKVYENEIRYPNMFNRVMKGGFDPEKDRNKYTYTKGMMGQRVLIANAIVRSMAAWHKENNHTVLLSKNVSMSADGTREYSNVGVASYGFLDGLSTISGKYGSLEKYDLGITRTGQMNNPYKIINASIMIEKELETEVDSDVRGLVVVGPLTEEELNYDRYEIGRLFKPTSYTKIRKRLGKFLKEVDANLKTNYYDEVTKLADAEAAERAANAPAPAAEGEAGIAPDQVSPDSVAPAQTTVTESVPAPKAAPVRTRAPAAAASVDPAKADKFAKLAGYAALPPEFQAKIKDVTVDAKGTVTAIAFDNPQPDVDFEVGCPDCGVGAPQSFPSCPNCGKSFTA